MCLPFMFYPILLEAVQCILHLFLHFYWNQLLLHMILKWRSVYTRFLLSNSTQGRHGGVCVQFHLSAISYHYATYVVYFVYITSRRYKSKLKFHFLVSLDYTILKMFKCIIGFNTVVFIKKLFSFFVHFSVTLHLSYYHLYYIIFLFLTNNNSLSGVYRITCSRTTI